MGKTKPAKEMTEKTVEERTAALRAQNEALLAALQTEEQEAAAGRQQLHSAVASLMNKLLDEHGAKRKVRARMPNMPQHKHYHPRWSL